MKTNLLAFLLFGIIAGSAIGQTSPTITSWVINTNGATGFNCSGCSPAAYGTILANVESVYYSSSDAYITTDCVPVYNIGPYAGNAPTEQNKVYKMTLNPAQNTGTATSTDFGAIGVWSNGVTIYNARDGFYWNNGTSTLDHGSGTWNRNAYVGEYQTFDGCLGHGDPSGMYHHHVNPVCLYDTSATSQHSPIIGYAFDGYPIYGAFAYTNTDGSGAIKRMRSSYKLTTATTRTSGPAMSVYSAGYFIEDYTYTASYGDLDEHNGRYCITPEYPNGTYAYFVTTDNSGTPEYPYTVGTSYYGVVATGNTGPSGGAFTVPNTATQYDPTNNVVQEVKNVNSKITLYPNPAEDNILQFQITDNTQEMNVKIMDYQGRTLVNREFAAGSYGSTVKIPAPYLNTGIYFVLFEINGTKEIQKVVFE